MGTGGDLGFVRRYSVAGQTYSGSMGLRVLAPARDGGFLALGRSAFGTFGGPSLVGRSDFVLARYDAEGRHLWTRSFPQDRRGDGPLGLHVAEAPTGELLVAGTYSGAPRLGGAPLPRARGQSALFLARFTSEGRHVWSRGFEAAREEDAGTLFAAGLAVGPRGEAVLTGTLRGTVDLGSGPLTSAAGGAARLFVASFDAEGRTRWSSTLAEATSAAPVSGGSAVAVDGAGEVLVAGALRPEEDAPVGASFVARLGADGAPRWVRRLEATRTAEVRSLAAGADGTVFFGGEFSGELRFAGEALRSRGGGVLPDVLLGALDAGGVERWVRELPDAGEGLVEQLALDAAGHLLVRGQLRSAADLGQGALLPGPFVASYAADGAPRWARGFDPHVQLNGLATLANGRRVVGGTLDAAVELEGERITPQGLTDLLYLQLGP